jgi:hypothetical protein
VEVLTIRFHAFREYRGNEDNAPRSSRRHRPGQPRDLASS